MGDLLSEAEEVEADGPVVLASSSKRVRFCGELERLIVRGSSVDSGL